MSYIKEINIKDIVIETLKEDLGTKDITSEIFIPKNKRVNAVISTKENCVVCGLSIAASVFKMLDKNINFRPLVRDGEFAKKGARLARLSGDARSILTAERVALNFLSLLSGIATTTRIYVNRVKPYKTKILDTRKTIPGLRHLEKYAVRIGGGHNHRLSLNDMVLVKDNHVKVIGGYNKLRPGLKVKRYKTELEVNNLKEFILALKLNPDIIMLDNMDIKTIKKALLIRRSAKHRPILEASGGITLKNVKKVAATGVEMISIGALTHSVDSVDISLDIL